MYTTTTDDEDGDKFVNFDIFMPITSNLKQLKQSMSHQKLSNFDCDVDESC